LFDDFEDRSWMQLRNSMPGSYVRCRPGLGQRHVGLAMLAWLTEDQDRLETLVAKASDRRTKVNQGENIE
jgi:hypothetical protein